MTRRRPLFRSLAIFAVAWATSVAALPCYGVLQFRARETGFSLGAPPSQLATGNLDLRLDLGVWYVDLQFEVDRAVFVQIDLADPSGFGTYGGIEIGRVSGRGDSGVMALDGFENLVVPDPAAGGIWITLQPFAPRSIFRPTGGRPVGLAVADWNLDRAPDLAVVDEAAGSVRVLVSRRSSPPSFNEPFSHDVPGGPRLVLAAPLDGDANPDFITVHDREGGAEVVVFLNTTESEGGVAFIRAASFAVDAGAATAALGDLDGDGVSDLVMLDSRSDCAGNSVLVVMHGRGDGNFGPPLRRVLSCPFFSGGLACPTSTFTIGDWNGDGSDDVAVFSQDPRPRPPTWTNRVDVLSLLVGRGRNLVAGPAFATPVGARQAVVGDFNGDGSADIAASFAEPPQLRLFENTSTGNDAAGNGAVCRSDGECLSGICAEGVCCATECTASESCAVPLREGTCADFLGLGVVADPLPCHSDAECYDIPALGDPGICVDGVCCDSRCEEGRCDAPGFAGTCISLPPPGSECCADHECASGFCRDGRCCLEDCDDGYCGHDYAGICIPLLDLADECDFDDQCDSGVCDRFEGICCSEFCSDVEDCNSPWAPGICAPYLATCVGDCNGDGSVSINELIGGVAIAMGARPAEDCPELDHDRNGRIAIDELVVAVLQAMTECRTPSP